MSGHSDEFGIVLARRGNDSVERAEIKEEDDGKVPAVEFDTEEDLYQTGVPLRDLSQQEVHQFPGLKREHWWYVDAMVGSDMYRQLWRPRHAPPPPKATLAEADVIPLATATLFSKLTFSVRSDLSLLRSSVLSCSGSHLS